MGIVFFKTWFWKELTVITMKKRFFCGYSVGEDALNSFKEICMPLGKRVLVIGGEKALAAAKEKLAAAFYPYFEIVDTVLYGNECSKKRAEELALLYKDSTVDFVVGVGGGKALDTAKCTAHLLKKSVVTVPTIASTCAATSALSVVYTENHTFSEFWHYEKPAYHCFIDTEIISKAPIGYLRAGIGDTVAKFYETEFSARGRKKGYSDQMALSVAAMCREPLMESAVSALSLCSEGKTGESLETAARIILVSTGMVSMMINPKFNGAVAHALFYGLTEIDGFEESFLHGDVVGYAAIVQLLLDGQTEEAKRLKRFLKDIGIETTLSERGIKVERSVFEKVLPAALKDPDMEIVPYEITEDMLYNAILEAEGLEEEK